VGTSATDAEGPVTVGVRVKWYVYVSIAYTYR